MKPALRPLLALLALTGAVFAAAPAAAQEGTGAIRALAFHDMDGNGVRDEGDPAISAMINLSRGDEFLLGLSGDPFSDPFGISLFDGLSPGDYTVAIELSQGTLSCGDGADFYFDPFPSSFCAGPELPWRATTPDSVSVTVESGMTVDVAFGIQPLDVAVITGDALLEDDFAPTATVIEAIVNGQECGTTSTTAESELAFALTILGAGEREGCATPGDTVAFRVGGVPAAETFTWLPFIDTPGLLGWQVQHLSAMEERAWYWLQGPSDDLPAPGSTVQATVDGLVCDETVVEAAPFFGTAGFPRLIVPSEEIQPGCGRPGAMVSILVDGVEVASLPWQPGLQRIDLGGVVGSPQLGSGPGAQGGVPIALLIVAALATAGLFVAGGGLLIARRR